MGEGIVLGSTFDPGEGVVTLVAAFEIHDTPVLLGDLMITRGREQLTRKKILRMRRNLAIGWSDTLIAATLLLKELDERLPRDVTIDELRKVLRGAAHEIRGHGLELVGWVLGDENTAFLWSSDQPQDLVTGPIFSVGTGAPWFYMFMADRDVTGAPPNTSSELGHASFQALVIAGNLMKSELTTRQSRSLGFGFGYEVLVAHRGRFQYVSPVVYAMTQANVDASGRMQSPFSSSGVALIRNVGEFTLSQSVLFAEAAMDIELVSPPIPRHSAASCRRVERVTIGPDRRHVFEGAYCVLFTQLYEDERPWPPLVGVIPRKTPGWLSSDYRGIRLAMDGVVAAAAEMGRRRMGRW